MNTISATIPAILTIENDWNSYPDYHSTTDLPSRLSSAMGGGILKMNIAVLADLSRSYASAGPRFLDGFEPP